MLSKKVSKKKENTLKLIKKYLQENYSKPELYDLVKNDYYSLKKVCEDNNINGEVIFYEGESQIISEGTSIYKCEKDGFIFYETSTDDIEDDGYGHYDEN
jgi:hypothetical protein